MFVPDLAVHTATKILAVNLILQLVVYKQLLFGKAVYYSYCVSFSDVLVDQVFDQLLAAAAAGVGFALCEHVGFQVGEADFSGFNLCSDTAVPRAVAIGDDFGQAAFFDASSRRFWLHEQMCPYRRCGHRRGQSARSFPDGLSRRS